MIKNTSYLINGISKIATNNSNNEGNRSGMNIEMYICFGNHIRNGSDINALSASYSGGAFSISGGQMNIEGYVYTVTPKQFIYDLDYLADGDYYFKINDEIDFKVQNANGGILQNEIALLKIIKAGSEISFEDIRPTTNLTKY